MLVTMVGVTCSGKSFFSTMLINKYGYKKVKEFTTRPRRPDESPDSYYFIDDAMLEKLVRNGDVYSSAEFDVVGDVIWTYGLFKDDIEIAIQSDDKYVLPTNVANIPNHSRVINCIIEVDNKTIAKRIINRENIEETIRRSLADTLDIMEFKTSNLGKRSIIVTQYTSSEELNNKIKQEEYNEIQI